jgi:hypothetical protein
MIHDAVIIGAAVRAERTPSNPARKCATPPGRF